MKYLVVNPLQCSCLENPRDEGAWWAAIYEVAQSRTLLKWHSSSSMESSPEKAMPPHSSTLAWKTPWTEEPGRLQSMVSQRVGHDWVTHFHFLLSWIGEGNGNPLQCSCLENPRDEGAWWAASYGVAQSWAWPKWLSSSSSGRATELNSTGLLFKGLLLSYHSLLRVKGVLVWMWGLFV